MDVQEKQLAACKEEHPGVETINSGNCSDLAAKLREVNNGNLLNVAFVTSGAKAAYDSTLPLLEPYGKLIVIGHPPKPLEISAYMMSDKRLR
ncbi:alcohol dehydrogenase [Pyrenophora seminiperda CCB06]|uniref:Alcohol dehydrogenase n=1 Tax=Pyrenophora seminiperda CCB06 TaxID=1302712 RepID=A0A3M7LXS2_9PLEO|nr:alcohol dehydrogenase [Pyrenophora seminiperda CCB06]